MTRQEYIDKEVLERLRFWSVIAASLGAFLFLILSIMDYIATPENFKKFLIARIIGASCLSSIAFLIYRVNLSILKTKILLFIVIICSAIVIEYMIIHYGGHSSSYVLGLIMLILCAIGLFPVGIIYSGLASVIIWIIYIAPIILFDETVTLQNFIGAAALFTATLFIVNLWKYIQYKSTIREIGYQYELDRDKGLLAGYSNRLEELVDERTQQLVHAQRVESMATMASGLAHDFNNILVTLQSMVDSVRYDSSSLEQTKESIDSINAEIKKGSRLVTKILEFRKGVKSEKVPVNINDVIRERAEIFKSVLPSDIHLKVELSEKKPEVMSDAELLEQVITNMVMNAKDAMPKGGTIIIATDINQKDDSSHDHVVITISDNGTGIGKEHLPFIFDPFYSTKEKGEGAGLGLATSDTIIKGHGGSIDVDSVPGMGTTFSINLPIRKKREDSARRIEAKKTTKAHILAIDDDEPITEMLNKVLTDEGYSVTIFNNPVEALDYFKSDGNSVDMVITDIVMPYMDGRQLIREIRALDPERKIVAITSLKGETAVSLKVDEIMRKPIPKESLISIVESVLKG